MADSPFDPGTQARINSLLDLTTGRIARTDPIHQAALAMATHLAPTYARQAMTAPSTPPPIDIGAAGSGSGSGGSGVPKVGTAIASALAAMAGGAGGGGDLGKIVDALKKLFGRGGRSTVQGDKPYPGGALMGPSTLGSGWPDFPTMPSEPPTRTLSPGVNTSYSFPSYMPARSFPSMGAGYPSDPSGGTGIGPGMQRYYGGGGGGGGDLSLEDLINFFLS